MDGSRRHTLGDGSGPNNVDVLYGFELDGRTVDLAVASVRPRKGKPGVKVWAIDAASRTLTDVTAGSRIKVFGGSEPYGVCGYRSARTGRSFFFVTDSDGAVEQYALEVAGDGRVGGTKVRAFRVGSVSEGCVADDELGFVYFSEESAGIWKFAAEPDAHGRGTMVARAGQNGLTADIEGIALYDAGQGRGYIIVSSQGSNTFKVYERGGDNRYVLTIDPAHGRIDDVDHTDGIAVTNCPTSREFGEGVFVVQDGENENGNQNFKLFSWRDIAGQKLLVDAVCRVRTGDSGGRSSRTR
jgi:3-phytase